jgi:hypothetical protein
MTTAEPVRDERTQLIQDYLDGIVSRGGVVNAEAQFQAGAYADRIAASRAYEAAQKANMAKMREQLEYATTDHALRARSARKQLIASYINRFTSENAAVTDEMKLSAERYADRVLAAADPEIARRQVQSAADRQAKAKAEFARDVEWLWQLLIDQTGSDDRRALAATARRFRRALDEIDARLFREALNPPAPQAAPQESGEDSAAATRGRSPRTIARKK